MRIREVVAVCALLNALSSTLGFTANRSEWRVVPQLKPRPQVSGEVLTRDDRAKGIDEALRSSGERKKPLSRAANATTTLLAGAPSPLKSERENLVLRLMSGGQQQRERFVKVDPGTSGGGGPLNVILLLIDGLDAAEEDSRTRLEDPESFPTQGLLQSCPEKPSADISRAFYFGERNSNCDCEDLLRSNIVALLSWAQHDREMSTSTLYEMPTLYSRRIEMDSSLVSPAQVRRIDRRGKASRTEPKKPHGRKGRRSAAEEGEEGGHVSGLLSRLREAFWRALLRSLSGADSPAQDDREHKRRSSPLLPPRGPSNFYELAARTLEELSSMPNERGYVLVATAGAHELPEALQLFRIYVSPLDTLTIVTSPCPADRTSLIPFFARGPNSALMAEANPASIHEIPDVIRAILSRECRGGSSSSSPGTCDDDDGGGLFVKPSAVLAFDDSVLIVDHRDGGFPLARLARENHRQQDKPAQPKFKRSEKERKEKAKPLEAKVATEKSALMAVPADDKRVTNESSETNAVDFKLPMLEDNPKLKARNSQDFNRPPSSLLLVTTILVISALL